MKTVNALKIRNHLGEVLDMLEENTEPIYISKGRKIRAVLITQEQFQKRFLDFQAEEKRKLLLDTIKDLRSENPGKKCSLQILREMRGYDH